MNFEELLKMHLARVHGQCPSQSFRVKLNWARQDLIKECEGIINNIAKTMTQHEGE